MILARVIGTLVSTIKTESHKDHKILVVKAIDEKGQYKGDSFLVLDTSQAGIGDCVIIIQEGNSIRSIIDNPVGAVDALAIGVVDYISISGNQYSLEESHYG